MILVVLMIIGVVLVVVVVVGRREVVCTKGVGWRRGVMDVRKGTMAGAMDNWA